jgi:hypothetical protein
MSMPVYLSIHFPFSPLHLIHFRVEAHKSNGNNEKFLALNVCPNAAQIRDRKGERNCQIIQFMHARSSIWTMMTGSNGDEQRQRHQLNHS